MDPFVRRNGLFVRRKWFFSKWHNCTDGEPCIFDVLVDLTYAPVDLFLSRN